MIDHPADKATGELIVTTKAEYQVVSNGAARRAGGSARRPAPHALEAGRPDLVLALLARRRALRRPSWRCRPRRAAVVLGVSAERREGPGGAREGFARLVRVLFGACRTVRLRQARARAGGRHGRRHRTREQHLLWGEGRRGGQRAGGPRDRASVVRQRGDGERLERRLAERRLRHLLHAALHRARRRPRRVRRRPSPQPRQRPAPGEVASEHAGRPRQSRRGDDVAEQSVRLSEGRLDAAHAARR